MSQIKQEAVKKDKLVNKYTLKGFTLDQLQNINKQQLVSLFRSRQRRRFRRSNSRKIKLRFQKLDSKLKKAKRNCQQGQKPAVVKTHMRNTIVLPSMVGNVIGVYNGKVYNPIQIKFDMIGRYLGEFSLTYKKQKHGRPGVGATKGSQHQDKK